MSLEQNIENQLIQNLQKVGYSYRDDIKDNQSLELNFRQKFNDLNQVNLSYSEFSNLLKEIIDSNVFTASKNLRELNTFIRDDDTPLDYSLVNLKDWCKNSFEVINQLK